MGRRRAVDGDHKQSETVETDLETSLEVTFERHTTFSHDSNYGADADGRRGVYRVDIDDDHAEDIEVLGVALEKYPKEFQEFIIKEVDQYLEDNEPEEQEPDNDPPERDEDR